MKLQLDRVLVVEGKYDAARLAGIVEGTILTTDGFAVFKDRAMQALFKRLARTKGLIVLTDSDAAGFRIRHFVTRIAGAEHVVQAYVPALPGKEPLRRLPPPLSAQDRPAAAAEQKRTAGSAEYPVHPRRPAAGVRGGKTESERRTGGSPDDGTHKCSCPENRFLRAGLLGMPGLDRHTGWR